MTEDEKRWRDKTDFLPGVDFDAPSATLRFQLVEGQVFTLKTWPDGSTARGSITVQQLEDMLGKKDLPEGFYDVLGTFTAFE